MAKTRGVYPPEFRRQMARRRIAGRQKDFVSLDPYLPGIAAMELRHLRYLVAIAEEGSFTQAAEMRLHGKRPVSLAYFELVTLKHSVRSSVRAMLNGTVEIIGGRERRRRWGVEVKLRIVAETQEPGACLPPTRQCGSALS